MKQLSTLLIVLLWCFIAQSQRTISGILRDDNGTPLPGVTVVIDGTRTGTITNLDGEYSIEAKVGDVLKYSYVGFEDKYVTVTDNGLVAKSGSKKKKKVQLLKLPIIADTSNVSQYKGYAIAKMGNVTPFEAYMLKYRYGNNYGGYAASNESFISTIKRNFIEYQSTVAINQAYRLPEFQYKFAQGRPVNGNLTWRGPETSEIFSWGPKIENLEYDGSLYAFDKNGRLTTLGYGTGKKAQYYNKHDFFKPTLSKINSFSIEYNNHNRLKYRLFVQKQELPDIIPTSYRNNKNLHFTITGKILRSITLSGKVYGSSQFSNLKDRYSQFAIISSLYNSPPTFDNSNGLANAASNNQAFLIDSITQRSFSTSANNPYWLLNNIYDKKKYDLLGYKTSISWDIYRYFKLSSTYNKSVGKNDADFQLPAASNSNDNELSFNRSSIANTEELHSDFRFNGYFGKNEISAFLSHSLQLNKFSYNHIHQNEIFYNVSEDSLRRREQYSTIQANYNYDRIYYAEASYTISQLNRGGYYYHSPALSVGMNYANLSFFREYISFINNLKVYGNYERSYAYSKLNSFYPELTTLNYTTSEINNYQNNLTYYHNAPEPEHYDKYNISLQLGLLRNIVTGELSLFTKTTTNLIAPTFNENEARLLNVGILETKGVEFNLDYNCWFWWNSSIRLGINFLKYRSVISKLNTNADYISLAGFGNIHTVLKEGEPYGALMGTSFLRNSEGEMLIDDDGFPIKAGVDIIGDPTPDYILNFNTHYNHKWFTISANCEYKKGGDVWNGTKLNLSYYGLSKESAEIRNTSDYIFPGINSDGNKNNIPVDFANPINGLEGNRWVRYGAEGIAEEGIEDGTYFRIDEVNMSYKFRISDITNFKNKLDLTVILFAKNLYTWSKYSGSNAYPSLWGYDNSLGIDFYNKPLQRTYGIRIKINY